MAPVQICHEWNTAAHLNEYEGKPERRPMTHEELQAFARAYVISNRPEEIFTLTGGPKVALGMSRSTGPTSLPIIPPDHQVTEKSRIDVVGARGTEVDYYRDL